MPERTEPRRSRNVVWPDGKTFAFTVFDDTDLADLTNVPPVYDKLEELGFRTTKTVWPLAGAGHPEVGGITCDDPAYARWVQDLASRGFEIAWHMATYNTSPREQTMRGLERFKELLGSPPRAFANHVGAYEGMYWGDARFGPVVRLLYNALTRFQRRGQYRGHVEGDMLFWGDTCLETFDYGRNFTFRAVNTLRACPQMPYHDPKRPYVRNWFAASEGGTLARYVETLSERNQDRLEAEGGACIMYTHFGAGFTSNGRLDKRFVELMERLSRKNGWFVPVSTLLDFLLSTRGPLRLSAVERTRLELSWLKDKLRVGYT